jgi:hypothetical protein
MFFSFLIAFSVLFTGGCLSYPNVITSQYVDKPVIMGPYWKIGGKLENYQNLKKQKGFKEFETEVERMISSSTQQHGNYQTTNTQKLSIHTDNISKDILMQNPTDDELILVRECYIGAYFMALPGGAVQTTFGGVDGIIVPKPEKGKSESTAEPKPAKGKKGKTK